MGRGHQVGENPPLVHVRLRVYGGVRFGGGGGVG